MNIRMNHSLDNYLSQTDLTWYRNISLKFAAQLKQHHMDAKKYTKQLSANQKDYASFASQIAGVIG